MLNIPVLFVLFNIAIANQSDRSFFIMVLLALLPLTFFPVTLTLFAVVRKWIVFQDDSSLFRSYFSLLRKSFKQGLKTGIIFTLIWAVCIFDLYYFFGGNQFLLLMSGLFAVFLFVYTINFLCAAVHYQSSMKELFNKALLLTAGNPIYLFVLISIASVVLLIAAYVTPTIFILCAGSLISYLSFAAFYRYYVKAASQINN